MQQLIQWQLHVSLLSTNLSFIPHSSEICMLVEMQFLVIKLFFGCSCTCEEVSVAWLYLCVMWVQGQYFHLRADWTLSCALWACLEMPGCCLPCSPFSLLCCLALWNIFFRRNGGGYLQMLFSAWRPAGCCSSQLCALKKQFATSLCLFFFCFFLFKYHFWTVYLANWYF